MRLPFTLAIVSLALSACSEAAPAPADATVDATPYELTIAAPAPDGFSPLAPDAGIEMRLGFQGFRYTRVVLIATGGAPATTPGRVRFDVEGFDPSEQRVNAVTFRANEAGLLVSQPLMIFANDISLSRAVGHMGAITIDLDDRRTRASATYAGVLRWDPTCVEDSNFQCLPTDGGRP